MKITPLILTYNEAPNIARTLAKLTWASDVIIIDSGSSDETISIAQSCKNVVIYQRTFDNHAAQWNYGVRCCATQWILALDADYIVSDELNAELRECQPEIGISAYYVRFRYCIQGKPLRGSLYPPRAVLFDRDKCYYELDGHTQALRISGCIKYFKGTIDHDDRKSLADWLWAQDRYAMLEVKKLNEMTKPELRMVDRVRAKAILAPAMIFFYILFYKGLIMDGWPGVYYCYQRVMAETILSMRIIESKMGIK